MSNSSPLGDQQLENKTEAAQEACEDPPQKHHLQAAFDRSVVMPNPVLGNQSYACFTGVLVQRVLSSAHCILYNVDFTLCK